MDGDVGVIGGEDDDADCVERYSDSRGCVSRHEVLVESESNHIKQPWLKECWHGTTCTAHPLGDLEILS